MKNKPSNTLKILTLSLLILYGLYLLATKFSIFSGSAKWMLGPAQLTDEVNPQWSPGSQYIAFGCGYDYPTDQLDPHVWDNLTWRWEAREICLFDTKTQSFRRITYGRNKGGTMWSFTGNDLAIYDGLTNEIKIWNMKQHRVVSSISEEGIPNQQDWICDTFNSALAAQSFFPFCQNKEADRYFEIPDVDPEEITWSPNEEYAAFNRVAFHDEVYGNKEQLVIMNNKGEVYQSEFPVFNFGHPIWNANSTILAWGPTLQRESKLSFTYIPTGETIYVSTDNFHFTNMAWSPSESKIVLAGNEQLEILEIRFDFQPFSYSLIRKEKFPAQGECLHFYVNLSWSPDEKHLAYEGYQEGVCRIWILDVESGEQKLMVKR